MKQIKLDHEQLSELVRFTDPFIHSPEKENEILRFMRAGSLIPPSFVEHSGRFLIFNGNHRVLVAIAHKLALNCIVLESLEDIARAQEIEGDRYRDISMVSPLTFDGLVKDLARGAEQYGHQDPERYTFRDL